MRKRSFLKALGLFALAPVAAVKKAIFPSNKTPQPMNEQGFIFAPYIPVYKPPVILVKPGESLQKAIESAPKGSVIHILPGVHWLKETIKA